MNWRERWRRHRRYGLEPLPADASKEQREERMRTLRQLRHDRRRRLAIRSSLGVVAVAAIVIALLAWLLLSVRGRDTLLAQIVARLPADVVLTWKSAEGPASGPLTLRGVHFSMPRQRDADCKPSARASCAMGTITFDAKRVVLKPALRPLLGRTLRLTRLDVEGATLDLPIRDTPFKLPEWPDVLPAIDPPLALQANAVRIDGLRVTQEGTPLIDIRRVRGGLDARRGSLHVERLAVDSDRGLFAVHGDYMPGKNYRSDLTATAVLPAPAGSTAPRLGLVARGDLSRMTVAVAGRAPAPVQATLTLAGDPDAPRWQLHAASEALDPSLLAGAGAGVPVRFDVSASGTGGKATLRGNFAREDFSAVIQPSSLQLEDQRLTLAPLVVDLMDGRVVANGRAELGAPEASSLKLGINARGVRWASADGAQQVLADGDFGLAGKPEQWAIKGQARLLREGERATVDLAGLGDRDGLRIDTLHAAMPQGRLDATGHVGWAPRLAWKADARLAGFDPGWFADGWNGAIHGQLASDGELRGGTAGVRAHVAARELGGTLRRRALSGHARLDIDGDRYSGDAALRIGGSRIDATARIAQALEIDAKFSPLRLDDLLPSAHGVLAGTLALRGARTAPDVRVDLTGRDLAYVTYRAASLRAHGQLPWQRGSGTLELDATGLQAGVALDSLHATLQGAVERLRLQASASGDTGRLALSGTAARQGNRWQGEVASLQLTPTGAAAWSLEAPARWSVVPAATPSSPTAIQLARTCLRSAIGGQLCANADWPRRGADVEGSGLPLALASDFLPARDDGGRWTLGGALDLAASVRPSRGGFNGTATVSSASGSLRDRRHARRPLVSYRNLAGQAHFDAHRIEASVNAALGGGGELDARIATGWDAHAPLAGHLRADTRSLIWMELLSPDIVEPTGRLVADVTLGGTRAVPALHGDASLTGFAAELPALGIALHDGDLRLRARDDGVAEIAGTVASGKGLLAVNGTLGWAGEGAPLQLSVRGNNVLLADTRQVRILASPDVQVQYSAGQPLVVRGKVTIPEADIHLDRLEGGIKPSPDVVVLDPETPPSTSSPLGLDLDVNVAVGPAVRLDGYGLKGSLSGNLGVRQLPGREMRATGALDVAGRYRAYGQDLTITRGKLLWSNAEPSDPLLDIRAERQIGDVTAGIQVSGRATAPQASVWSNPAMSQSEALAYLTLGRPLPSLNSGEAQQVDLARSTLNAGVGLLTSQIGARIGLDDAGVTTSRALGGQVLGVGKYLSPKLYVSYGVSLLGTGQVITLKYLLRKGFDVEIESSTVQNRASVNWRKEK